MRRVLTTVMLSLLVVTAALGFDTWSKSAAIPEVAAAPAPEVPESPGVGALGRVAPSSRIRRIAPPGGLAMNRVDRLSVQEGEHVTAGEVLAEFADATSKDAAVLQAQAAVAEAQTSLARIKAGGRPSEIEAWRARIDSLRAQEDIAQRDAARAQELVPSGAGARAVAERDRAAAERAVADRHEAEARLTTLVEPRPEDVAYGEAQLQTAIAQFAKARADASLSRVLAPIDGTIVKIYAHPGELVGPEGLLDLADLDQLDVVADVYETDLPRVHVGSAAEIIVPGDAKRYQATVRDIGWMVQRKTTAGVDPIAEVDSRTSEVRLTLGDAGRTALGHRINMQVQVAIRP
jgi:HlyD family secretion protein